MNKKQLYVFRDSQNIRHIALTDEKTGAKLPNDVKWLFWKDFEAGMKGRIAFGLEEETAAFKTIEEQGYYLYTQQRILKPSR